MALSQRDRLRRQQQKTARRRAVVAEKRKAELTQTGTRLAEAVAFAAAGRVGLKPAISSSTTGGEMRLLGGRTEAQEPP